MTRSLLLALGAATVLVAAFAVWWITPRLAGLDPTNPRITLADIERVVSARYPVPETTVPDLAAALADPNTVVFDVREPAEYAQSHIPGARRIDPQMSADAFMAAFGRDIAGKRVVFYCAVGVRSGIAAQRTRAPLTEAGAAAVYNLRGGVFRWHATGAPLVAEGRPASGVHPYDAAWGQLLDRTIRPQAGP